jgi:hypothetical protein
MAITRTVAAVAIVLGSWSSAFASRAPADQDVLARAKALYTSAAYDEALVLLNQFNHSSATDEVEAEEYRAFCLLALGRGDDARDVIRAIVEANPAFQPSETQVSPRLQDAFREVRRRVLPSIVRQSYAEAKAAFERKDFELAGSRFNSVLALLDNDDMKGSGDLSDLGILSNGFLDLIRTMPPADAPPPAVPTIAIPQPPPAPAVPTVYDARNQDVTPPTAVSQVVPAWRPTRQDAQTYDATLTLVIDEGGDVTSVSLEGSLQPAYALLLRRAASGWKYQPATKAGVPVKYRRVVAIHLNASDVSRTSRRER